VTRNRGIAIGEGIADPGLFCEEQIAPVLQLANSDEVPVRLILSVDAEMRVQQAETARASEGEKWRYLTVSTVLEDGRFDSRLSMRSGGRYSGAGMTHGNGPRRYRCEAHTMGWPG
jgi:hypothetical protein